MHLKQTAPAEAKKRYLADKRPTVTDKTLYNYDTSLTQFCEWLEEREIRDLRELDSDHIQQFKEYRLRNVATITARNDLITVRQFVAFCETILAVSYGLSDMIRIPKTDDQDEICDDS